MGQVRPWRVPQVLGLVLGEAVAVDGVVVEGCVLFAVSVERGVVIATGWVEVRAEEMEEEFVMAL